MTDLAARKAALLSRRQDLLDRLERVEQALDRPVSKDWEDAAQEREDDQMLNELGRVEQAELARIDAALQRIASGDYGRCARCGEPIAPARLEAMPDATLCTACA